MAEPPTSGPLTLAQLAAAAGVSVPTVSKVINQRTDVAPATRARVERVIAEHGYILNRAGRSLRKGRSGEIDFVVQSLNSDYAAQILRGVEDALSSTEVRAVLASTHDHQQRERQWLQRLSEGSTDGAIVVPSDVNMISVQTLRSRHIPFVVVDPTGELGPGDLSVSAGNWAGGKIAVEYLISLGHRRIAALLGPALFPSTQDRLSGYRSALSEAGIPLDPILIRHTDWWMDAARQEMQDLLSLPVPPTAVLVGSDLQSLGVYRALYDRDLRVPGDVSVVGFDDMPYAAWVTPALTTVRQPLVEMGRVATKMLLRVIAGEPVDAVRVELATPLVRRSSCAPPASLGG